MFTEAQESAYKAGLVRFHKPIEEGHRPIGAGFYIDHGYVLTCAHVVTQCLGLGKNPQGVPVDSLGGKRVEIDFLFVAGERFLNAEIVQILWRLNGNDLAVLKVLEPIPAGVHPLALPESTYYRDHRYHVLGFPDGHPDGLESSGEFVTAQAGGLIQMEGIRTQGVPIEPGFSGAPVWDEQLGGIVGITVSRDQERESAKVAFMIPYQTLKPTLEAIALFDLLLPESDKLAPHWKTAYRLVYPENSTMYPFAATLPEAIVQVLVEMSGQGRDYSAIQQFIGYLALPELGLRMQPRLLQWLQQQVETIEDLSETIRQKIADQQAKQSNLGSHLLFWVRAELNSDRYYVQAYLVGDRDQYQPNQAERLTAPTDFLEKTEDKVDQPEIEKILRACLNESAQKLGDIRQLRLEVFLPLHRLNWEVDRWSATEDFEPDLIGCRYQVVLRIAHRWEDGYSQYQGDWNAKWKRLESLSDRPAYRGFICGDGQKFKKIRQELRRDEIAGLILAECPDSLAVDASNPLIALLHSGSLAAIWIRRSGGDDHTQQFKQLLVGCHAEFERLFTSNPANLGNTANLGEEQPDHQNCCDGLLGCYLPQMPESIRALRAQADQECDDGETHVGHHIGFIWEDPKLVPPGAVKLSRLQMPT